MRFVIYCLSICDSLLIINNFIDYQYMTAFHMFAQPATHAARRFTPPTVSRHLRVGGERVGGEPCIADGGGGGVPGLAQFGQRGQMRCGLGGR